MEDNQILNAPLNFRQKLSFFNARQENENCITTRSIKSTDALPTTTTATSQSAQSYTTLPRSKPTRLLVHPNFGHNATTQHTESSHTATERPISKPLLRLNTESSPSTDLEMKLKLVTRPRSPVLKKYASLEMLNEISNENLSEENIEVSPNVIQTNENYIKTRSIKSTDVLAAANTVTSQSAQCYTTLPRIKPTKQQIRSTNTTTERHLFKPLLRINTESSQASVPSRDLHLIPVSRPRSPYEILNNTLNEAPINRTAENIEECPKANVKPLWFERGALEKQFGSTVTPLSYKALDGFSERPNNTLKTEKPRSNQHPPYLLNKMLTELSKEEANRTCAPTRGVPNVPSPRPSGVDVKFVPNERQIFGQQSEVNVACNTGQSKRTFREHSAAVEKCISSRSNGKKPPPPNPKPTSIRSKLKSVHLAVPKPEPIDGNESVTPIVQEFIKTEEIYGEQLRSLLANVHQIFSLRDIPDDLRGKKYVLIGNIEQIAEFHAGEFLPMLRGNRTQLHRIITKFQRFVDAHSFYCYILYNMNLRSALELFKAHRNYFENSYVAEGDLLVPMERLKQYTIFLDSFSTLTQHRQHELSKCLSTDALFLDNDFLPEDNDCFRALYNSICELLQLAHEAERINDFVQCVEYSYEDGICAKHFYNADCIFTKLYAIDPHAQGRLLRYGQFQMDNVEESVRYTANVYCYEKSIIITDNLGHFLDCLQIVEVEITTVAEEYFTLFWYSTQSSKDRIRKYSFYADNEMRYDWLNLISATKERQLETEWRRSHQRRANGKLIKTSAVGDKATKGLKSVNSSRTINLKRHSLALASTFRLPKEDMKISLRRGLSEYSVISPTVELREKNENYGEFGLDELISTEKIYVDNLLIGIQNYSKIFNRQKLHPQLRGKKYVLLRNIEQIAEFHSEEVLPMLEHNRTDMNRLVDEFQLLVNNNSFYCYVQYAQHSQESYELYQTHNQFFQIVAQELQDKLGLNSFLLQPIQRCPRYILLFTNILEILFKNRNHINSTLISKISILVKRLASLNAIINDAITIRKFFCHKMFYEAGFSIDDTLHDGHFYKSNVFQYEQNFLSEVGTTSRRRDIIVKLRKSYCRVFLFKKCLYIFGLQSKNKDEVTRCLRYAREHVHTLQTDNRLSLLLTNVESTITLVESTDLINTWMQLIRLHWLDDPEGDKIRRMSVVSCDRGFSSAPITPRTPYFDEQDEEACVGENDGDRRGQVQVARQATSAPHMGQMKWKYI